MRMLPSPPPGPILGLYAVKDAGAYYRVQVPLSHVPGATWAHLEDVTAEQLDAAETVIWYRAGGRVRDIRAAFRDLRKVYGVKRIIVDYDDSMFIAHEVREVRAHKGGLRGLSLALELCDGVIVQSEPLVEHFRGHTRAPIAVSQNLIRPEDWPEPRERPAAQPPVIVLAGSASHLFDWQQVVPALENIRENSDVELRVIGCPHPRLRELATDFRYWFDDISDYAASLYDADVGLCPLLDTAFNRHKSAVKAYEYALAGCAVVGSPLLYGELLNGRGAIVSEHPTSWLIGIGMLLANRDLRREAAAELRKYVIEHLDARQHAARLTSIYTQFGGDAWQH
jgi:glycosyltransferase involved in cell wall biosynthesis